MNIIEIAKEVFEIEADSIRNLSKNLDSQFEIVIKEILKSKGKLIVSGMGKSGIIGKKISATLSSTGTPSFFLHPAEAYHGDLGVVQKQDIVILISNSGESDEILKLIPFFKSQGNILISMSGKPKSTLAKNTDYHLNIAVEKEVCPLQLAPTSSTTATLVMGDALAVALMKLRNFKDDNFAKFHPGGNLGKRLLTKTKDIMKTANLPTCSENTNIKNVIHKITDGKYGIVVVLQDSNILGVITDGDIRRTMENSEKEFFQLKAENIMSLNPKIVFENEKIEISLNIMNENKINSLLVVDDKHRLVGITQMYDLGV